MFNRLFGALAVAVGVGAVVAVKLLKDQKETENKEENDDNEVRFITLSDGDGVALMMQVIVPLKYRKYVVYIHTSIQTS